MRPALHTWLPLALGLLAWPGGAASAPDPEVARRSVGRAEVVAALERSGFSADAVLGADAAGAHVVNVMTGTRHTQSFLRSRGLNYDLTLLSNLVIDALPDIFDFGYLYGSRGVLQGVNAVDAYDRGLYSNFVTHEILHQWGSYLSSTLGLRVGAHYKVQSSVGSLLGGCQWTDTGDGLFDPVCAAGSNNASQASPLDLYLMGLIDGSGVPPLHVSKTFFDCSKPIYNYTTLAMADLQAVQGVRTPGRRIPTCR
jgi:hypothetical protein